MSMNELMIWEGEIDVQIASSNCPIEIDSLLETKLRLIDAMGTLI